MPVLRSPESTDLPNGGWAPSKPSRAELGAVAAGRPTSIGRLRLAARTGPGVIAALVASTACWGFATVASKGALSYLPPVTLLTAQLSASVAFLWTIVMITRSPLPPRRGAGSAALSGVLEPGLAYTAGMSGLMLTGASQASLIGAIEPLLVVLLAWLFFGRRPERNTIVALAVAIPGTALLVYGDHSGNYERSLAGDGLILLGTLFAAFYVIRSSQLSSRIAPLPLLAIQNSVGLGFVAALLVVVLASGLERPDFTAVSGAGWLLVVVSGVVQYALAFWLYLLGLRMVPVDKAALFLTLTPVFGVGGAVALLGETLSVLQVCGAGLTLGAIVATSANRGPESGGTPWGRDV